MNEHLFQVIQTIIPVLGAVITYFIIPYIKATTEKEKLNQYKEWAALAVKTAEMLWEGTGHGEDKKAYVTAFLNNMLNSRKTVITEEQLHVLIEATVREIKEEIL